jgi:hypothetical protein
MSELMAKIHPARIASAVILLLRCMWILQCCGVRFYKVFACCDPSFANRDTYHMTATR